MSCLEIGHIQFGILSSDAILKMSVCELNSVKLIGPNSVYDPRMGVLELNEICPTCNENSKNCVGHFWAYSSERICFTSLVSSSNLKYSKMRLLEMFSFTADRRKTCFE